MLRFSLVNKVIDVSENLATHSAPHSTKNTQFKLKQKPYFIACYRLPGIANKISTIKLFMAITKIL